MDGYSQSQGCLNPGWCIGLENDFELVIVKAKDVGLSDKESDVSFLSTISIS